MGQAQRSGQRDIRYKDVELDLWELGADEEEYGYGGGSSKNGGRQRNNNNYAGYAQRERKNGVNRTQGRGGRNNVRRAANGDQRSRQDYERRAQNERRGYEPRHAQSANIMLYEQRQNRDGNSRVRRKQTEGGRQIQDIRRYQGGRAARSAQVSSIYLGDARSQRSLKRRRARKRKVYLTRMMAVVFVVLCLGLIYYMTGQIFKTMHRIRERNDDIEMGIVQPASAGADGRDGKIAPPDIIEDYLEVNEFSRPGTKLTKVNSIFVHYTANPGTSAAQNRSYFANLALTQERSASAHLIIGYDGELIQCIPFDEQAYAVMTRNEDSISIECCFVSEDGSFTQETYDTLVHTLAWLIDKYDLSVEDILRHYDCGGKKCPIYYVENEEAWARLLRDVEAYAEK